MQEEERFDASPKYIRRYNRVQILGEWIHSNMPHKV